MTTSNASTDWASTAHAFAPILARIKTDSIRASAEALVAGLPIGVVAAPGSMTGKYHPADERGEGGLLVHIFRFAELVPQAAKMVELNEVQEDELLITAIIHDAFKVTLSRADYWMHPLKSAEYALAEGLHGAAQACALHEGPWTDKRISDSWGTWWVNAMPRAAHMVDFFVSRSEAWTMMQPGWAQAVKAGPR